MNLELFLQGYKDRAIVEYVTSDTYKDEKGKPIAWKLRAIDSELDQAIRNDCKRKIRGSRGGVSSVEFDSDKYGLLLSVNSVVEPNLKAADWQDAFGVKSAESLLRKMLLPGELQALQEKVFEINGFDMGMDDLVEEAKN